MHSFLGMICPFPGFGADLRMTKQAFLKGDQQGFVSAPEFAKSLEKSKLFS